MYIFIFYYLSLNLWTVIIIIFALCIQHFHLDAFYYLLLVYLQYLADDSIQSDLDF